MTLQNEQWLSNCPPDFQPQIFRQNVCDIFITFILHKCSLKVFSTLWKNHTLIENWLLNLNRTILFSFLEINICHLNNKFTSSAYRKSTFSGVLTNVASFMYLFPINVVYLTPSYFAASLYAVVIKKVTKKLFIWKIFSNKMDTQIISFIPA